MFCSKIIFITIISILSDYALCQNSCVTPDGKTSLCVNPRDCTSPPTQDSTCGSDKVCCSNNQPPSIENHKNLHLLPQYCGTVDGSRSKGSSTRLLEYRWMALLSYLVEGSEKSFECLGIVINSKYILTAAHCIVTRFQKLYNVRVGDYNLSEEEDCTPGEPKPMCAPQYQDIEIEEVVVHPNFMRRPTQNDIALLRLRTPIDMSKGNILPICLPTTRELRELHTDGLNMTVLGWGIFQQSDNIQELRQSQITVLDNLECENKIGRFSRKGFSASKQICGIGDQKRDTCSDLTSGSPLMYVHNTENVQRYVAHGIVSFGLRSCAEETVFTRIGYYMDWILNSLKP